MSTASAAGVEPAEFFSDAAMQDPYPLYARLRPVAPVHRVGDSGFYLVCGWDALNEAVARVDEIVYGASREDAAVGGFDDAFIYDEIALPPGQRRIPMRRAAEEPAAALFREWLELEGRTPY